jgi:hypothetical protein
MREYNKSRHIYVLLYLASARFDTYNKTDLIIKIGWSNYTAHRQRKMKRTSGFSFAKQVESKVTGARFRQTGAMGNETNQPSFKIKLLVITTLPPAPCCK